MIKFENVATTKLILGNVCTYDCFPIGSVFRSVKRNHVYYVKINNECSFIEVDIDPSHEGRLDTINLNTSELDSENYFDMDVEHVPNASAELVFKGINR